MSLAHRLHWLSRSSTLRLALLLSVVFSLGMTVAIVTTLALGRDAVLRRVDATLEGLATSLAADEVPEDPFAAIIRPLEDLSTLPGGFGRIARAGGGTVALDRPYRRSDVWRALVAEDLDGRPVLIAVPLEDSEDALELLGEILVTTAAVVVLLTLAIGLAVGLFAQRRLRRINTTLEHLARGDLLARTGVQRARDDLDDVAQRLDQTAGELERLVTQTRNLSANLAHDLRTPLARLRARLEVLPDGEARGAALEEAARLSGIFDTIMRVARIEAGQGKEGFAEVDLTALSDEIVEIFEPVVEDAGKKLRRLSGDAGTVFADRQMVIQAVANLIQNALVHGGDEITIETSDQAIGIADNGPGVPMDQVDEILKPMVRLDAARHTEGSGLGLALVRAVADRHGATLMLTRNQPSGLRVVLNFAKK